ncbi:MAG: helix-turn-helix transcriptional regulator [Phycisphaerae bacterium]
MSAADAPALDCPPLNVGAKEAARLCGISTRTLYAAVASGMFPPGFRILGRRLWPRAEIVAWCAAGCPPMSRWQAQGAEGGR